MSDRTWHEDDGFWYTLRPVLFGEARIESASGDVDAIAELAGCRPGARVLDLPCGVGRHCLELARRGFIVTGVDRTASYIEEAIGAASEQNLEVEFLVGDMRTFRRDETFDLVLNLFTSLGYFEDREEDRRAIENAARSLKPGGTFIVDVMGRETMKRLFQHRNWIEEGDTLLLEDAKVNDAWDTVENHWTVISAVMRREAFFSLHVYSAEELSSLIGGCGLEVTGTYGWFDGSPYDDHARRLVVTARKPER